MPRPRKTDKPYEKTISIPTSIVARIDLELYSDLEGKVPHGKWSELVTMLLRQHIAKLDEIAAHSRVNDQLLKGTIPHA